MESQSSDIDILKQYLKSWEGLRDDQIEFERLAGLSNVIWKVTALAENIVPKSVVYRKFATGSEFVDRSLENYIFNELSKANLGPLCFGYSSEFRIEEYYDCNEVADEDIRNQDIRRKLAKNLAALHSIKLSKVDERPYILKNIEEGYYLKEIEKKLANTEFSEDELKIIDEIKKTLFSQDEIDFLTSILPKSPESVTFSHNDLHAGNILHLKESEEYLFIDCEYSSYNYRGFDIANLFVETILDYTHDESPFYKIREERYPPKNELEDFVKYYAFFKVIAPKDLNEEEAVAFLEDSAVLDQYLKTTDRLVEFIEAVDQIMYEASIGKLLSHYHWTMWSVIFSKKKETKFDYIAYANDRFKLYEKSKAEFLAKKVKID